jgi:hypothetical protein
LPGCSDITNKTSTKFFKASGDIGIVTRVEAQGSLDNARKGLDPQSWHRCSRLWGQSYLVKVNNNGNVVDNGKCAPNNMKDCMAAVGAALPLGESYDTNSLTPFPRPLFENFICDTVPCDVRLLLHIVAFQASTPTPTPTPSASSSPSVTSTPTTAIPNPTPTDPQYTVTYDLPSPWKNFPFPRTDYGQVRLYAFDLGNGDQALTAVSDKTFGFEDWSQNAAIYMLLQRIEMADYLAELVCCKAP